MPLQLVLGCICDVPRCLLCVLLAGPPADQVAVWAWSIAGSSSLAFCPKDVPPVLANRLIAVRRFSNGALGRRELHPQSCFRKYLFQMRLRHRLWWMAGT